jgi:hypothetical protein
MRVPTPPVLRPPVIMQEKFLLGNVDGRVYAVKGGAAVAVGPRAPAVDLLLGNVVAFVAVVMKGRAPVMKGGAAVMNGGAVVDDGRVNVVVHVAERFAQVRFIFCPIFVPDLY